MRHLKAYLHMLDVSIQAQLQYPRSLTLQTLGQFLLYLVEFSAVAGLFSRFGSIAGWSLAEAALLYGFADLAFATADAFSRGFDLLGQQLRRGDFDRVLARPLPPFLQVLGQELTLRRAGRFLEGALIFAWALGAARPGGGAVGALALLLGWLGAVTIFVSIITIQGALSFWTVEGLEIMNALSYGGRQVSSYPMTAYRAFLRRLFLIVVPIGSSVYVPVCAFLGRPAFLGWPLWAGLVTPFAALPFAGLAALAWKAGLARYESAGG